MPTFSPGTVVTSDWLNRVDSRLEWDIYVTDPAFGAVNDGVTDSTAALAAAVTYANSLYNAATDSINVAQQPRLIFPPGLGFRTTATLSIRAGVNVIMQSPLWVVSSASSPIIGIDLVDARGLDYQAPRQVESVFDIRRVTQSDWASDNDIGLRIPAIYTSSLHIKRIDGFTVGFDICAGYGQVRIGDIRDCRKNIVSPRTSPENFTNHARFTGGSFNCQTGLGTGLSRYGIIVRPTTPNGINTLLFDGQSFELAVATAGAAECLPYFVDGSAANALTIRAINQRAETCGGTFAKLTGAVRNCEFGILDGELEYTYPTSLMLDDQSTGGGGNVLYRHHGATAPHWVDFFNTGRFAEKAVQLTGGVVSLVNLEAAINVGASPATQTFIYADSGPVFDTSGNMTCVGPLYGVRVRLNGARSFGIVGRKPTGVATDVLMLLFDSSGTQITTTGAVKHEQSSITPNTGVYGGLYQVGVYPVNNARAFEAVFQFDSNVDTVFITVSTKTNGWALRRVDNRPEWFSSTSHKNGAFVGTAIPIALTNVTYSAGMRVENIVPAVGSPKAWVLDSGGTWRSEGNL